MQAVSRPPVLCQPRLHILHWLPQMYRRATEGNEHEG